MNREDLIRHGDALEQDIIEIASLNKIEAFYVFNSDERTLRERLNEVFELRGEPYHFPDDSEEEEFFDITEEDELIAQYGLCNLEFVDDQEWVSDDLSE